MNLTVRIVQVVLAVIGCAAIAYAVVDCLAHDRCESYGRVQTYDCTTAYTSCGHHVETICDWRCVYSPEVDR